MKRLSKIFLYLLFLYFSCFQQTLAQEGDGLMAVRSKLEAFNKHRLQEKLYVHTDKSFYTAGEIVWFKIYAVDGFYNKPLHISKVAYVELLDKNNHPIIRAKIAMDKKGGAGSLQLPLTMSSGYFTLRAYTNWMKNFGPELFFEKSLTIINPLKSLDENKEKTANNYTAHLFPEGGNLVNGLPSKVGFKLTDKSGKGTDGTGFLLNQKNDTLARFKSFKFGLGNFEFTPIQGHSYKTAFVFNDGSIITTSLPNPFNEGYVMRVEEGSNQQIKIIVRSNAANRQPEIFLMVQARQLFHSSQRGFLDNGTATFYLDKSSLPEGVSQITVFNNNKQPVCERLIFTPPSKNMSVAIKANKPSYGLRDKISLLLEEVNPNQANLSLAVYKVDSLQTTDPLEISSYIWLTSELNGHVEHPEFYLSPLNDEVKKATDNLLLTHGWRRFKWEDLQAGPPSVTYPTEHTGHTITGKVMDTRTNTPAKNIQVYLSIPDASYKLYTSISDAEGLVKFDVQDYYGPGEIVIQTNSQRDSSYRVDNLSPFSENYTTKAFPSFTIEQEKQALLTDHSISMQAQHIYIADSLRRFSEPYVADTLSYYGRPLYTYHLDDYTRFTTMEEVLREYVREINVGVKGSGTGLRLKLFNEDARELYTDDILVTVDGVPYFETGKIFSLDPLKIKKLDIITKNYVLGNSVFHGLINFASYQGNFKDFELNSKAITLDYEGLQIQREFYSPDYSIEQLKKSRIPDLRSTLYWSPFVTSNEVQFYSGDNKGKYLVVVQGIDQTGKAVSRLFELDVK